MKPIYKKIKKLVPCCPVCDVELMGNGSLLLPYECLCGKWQGNYKDLEYKILKD